MKKRTYGYDPDEDYSKKMAEAAAEGDLAAAAKYEQQRNEKIAGEGLTQYQTTNQYAQFLPKTNEEQMADILEQIQKRGGFSFDLNGDALYQQYKDQYMAQGKLAMQDAIGQAAALTGGYGNSYAQSAGQQAYQDYLGGLNQVIPELYELAYDRYAQEGDDLWRRYELYADRAEAEKAQLRDEQNQAYQQAQDSQKSAYSLALTMLQSGVMPSESLLAASGISAEDAKAIYDQVQREKTTQVSGGRSGGSSSSGSSASKRKSVTLKDRMALAEQYEAGGDSAIASSIAAYRAQGYDADELLDWIHTYYTYRPPQQTGPWWQDAVNFAKRNGLLSSEQERRNLGVPF